MSISLCNEPSFLLQFFDHVKTGIEDVCGHWGHNFWRDK